MRVIGSMLISTALFVVFLILNKNGCTVGSSLAEIFLGISLPNLWMRLQDVTDNTNWKASQRRLVRGGFIKDNTIIRISFSYLYRIKIDNKYFLVLNSRNTGKYQPVGGVYKFKPHEKNVLDNKYHVIDDDKISIDNSSRDDYRLQLKNRYLRSFLRRFDSKAAMRERIDNASREFKEELIDTGILSWTKLKYRICGRHIAEIKYSDHFQIYELLLADIVEVIPTLDQGNELRDLMGAANSQFKFVTADIIKSLGINTASGDLKETIADHTIKILQETEDELLPIPGAEKKSYFVTL